MTTGVLPGFLACVEPSRGKYEMCKGAPMRHNAQRLEHGESGLATARQRLRVRFPFCLLTIRSAMVWCVMRRVGAVFLETSTGG